jgi:hypothetical protein
MRPAFQNEGTLPAHYLHLLVQAPNTICPLHMSDELSLLERLSYLA